MPDRPRKKGVKFINSIVKHQSIGWNSCIDDYEAWLESKSIEVKIKNVLLNHIDHIDSDETQAKRQAHAIVEYLRGKK